MEENLFFDALGINIKIDEAEYAEILKELLIDINMFLGFPPDKEQKVHRNYHNCMIWQCDNFKLFVNYIGTNKDMGAFIEIKGHHGCKLLVEFLTKHAYKWSLTRCDIALDFDKGYESFHKLSLALQQYSKVKNIQHITTQGDWIRCVNGRTLYVGSKQSATQIRLYEKSQEQYSKGNMNYPPDIVRVEVQFRPSKPQKRHINKLCPLHILSFNRNLLDFFNPFFKLSVAPIRLPTKDDKTSQDTLNYVFKQYRRTIRAYIDDVGYKSAMFYFIRKIKSIMIDNK